jgi:tetratricopeptide (TPR) repeat protein
VKRGGQINGRAKATGKVEGKVLPKRRLAILVCFALSIFLNAFASDFKQPTTLKELLVLSPADLEKCDLARMNLLCAEGLPGSEDLKIDDTLATLDSWAQHVKSETDRNFHHFQEGPKEFNNSEAYYRALLLITVVQQDFNVHYNPAHITTPDAPEPDNTFFTDSKDLFLHGLASSRAMGTCISMPVFYVAIGQRLGYPMKLVTAKDHLFARWESADGKERFNIEATGQGLSTPDDDFYKKWPFPISDEDIKISSYLKAQTAAQELSLFLETRGHCLRVAGRLPEAKATYLEAQALTPQWPEHKLFLAAAGQPLARPAEAYKNPNDFVEAMNRYNQQIMAHQIPMSTPPPTDPSDLLSKKYAPQDAWANYASQMNQYNQQIQARQQNPGQPIVPILPPTPPSAQP